MAKKTRTWAQRDYLAFRKGCDHLKDELDKWIGARGGAGSGARCEIDYFALRGVLEFVDIADMDYRQLVQAREVLAPMHLPDA